MHGREKLNLDDEEIKTVKCDSFSCYNNFREKLGICFESNSLVKIKATDSVDLGRFSIGKQILMYIYICFYQKYYSGLVFKKIVSTSNKRITKCVCGGGG